MSERNRLYYGDNLKVLREHLPAESVDLIYLDPPFNSARNYNVLFKDESGNAADAQITAFEDTWHWGAEAAATFDELVTDAPERISTLMGALRAIIGTNQMMAYLVMMTARLVELHRVLKPTGSLYLHCDPTASHYLKLVLDCIFGGDNFLAEIVWKRTSAHNTAKRPGPVHDIILMYGKSDDYIWNSQYLEYSDEHTSKSYKHLDQDGRRYALSDLTGAGIRHGETGKSWRGIDVTAKGRHWSRPPAELDILDEQSLIAWPKNGGMPRFKKYLDEMSGVPIQDVWDDVLPLSSHSKERLGYPTQKPVALLERIIAASSNPGDVVLDPFCGCGTAIDAAQNLGRRWIGIDVTHLSIALQKYRLKDRHGLEWKADYDVIGEPEDEASARQLANEDRYQFQWWALSLVKAKPLGGESGGKTGKKGADRGIDGVIDFIDNRANKKYGRILIQVKSGNVNSGMIRDLVGTLEREQAQMAVFVSLEAPSKPMITEAASAGFFQSRSRAGMDEKYPKIQIVTIGELLAGKMPDLPMRLPSHRRAVAAKGKGDGEQLELFRD